MTYNYPIAGFNVQDEIHVWEDATPWFRLLSPSTKRPSKIRVTLSRPLTWAEWEDLTGDGISFGEEDLPVKVTRANDRFDILWFEVEAPSREFFGGLANLLATEYVNVFPKAVYTKQEMK